MNHIQFTNHIAVITGGTQGLGEATARLFAERGAAGIVICGRNAARGQAIARELACQAIFVSADLEKVDDCRNVIAQADQAFGRVDILVNDDRRLIDFDQSVNGCYDSPPHPQPL